MRSLLLLLLLFTLTCRLTYAQERYRFPFELAATAPDDVLDESGNGRNGYIIYQDGTRLTSSDISRTLTTTARATVLSRAGYGQPTSRVQIRDSAVTQSYTYSFWVQINAPGDRVAGVITSCFNTPGVHYIVSNFGSIAAGHLTGTFTGQLPLYVQDPTPLTPGIITQYILTYDHSIKEMVIYRNGIEVARGSTDTPASSGWNGGGQTCLMNFLNLPAGLVGLVDDVRAYDYVLDEFTIRQIGLPVAAAPPLDTSGRYYYWGVPFAPQISFTNVRSTEPIGTLTVSWQTRDGVTIIPGNRLYLRMQGVYSSIGNFNNYVLPGIGYAKWDDGSQTLTIVFEQAFATTNPSFTLPNLPLNNPFVNNAVSSHDDSWLIAMYYTTEQTGGRRQGLYYVQFENTPETNVYAFQPTNPPAFNPIILNQAASIDIDTDVDTDNGASVVSASMWIVTVVVAVIMAWV